MTRSLCSLYPPNAYYDFWLHFLLVCLQSIETLVHIRCFPKLGMHYFGMPRGRKTQELETIRREKGIESKMCCD